MQLQLNLTLPKSSLNHWRTARTSLGHGLQVRYFLVNVKVHMSTLQSVCGSNTYGLRPNEILVVRRRFKEDLGSVRLSCNCMLWTYRKRYLKAGHQIASTIISRVVFWLQTIKVCFTINLYDGPFTIALRITDKGLFEFSTSSEWSGWTVDMLKHQSECGFTIGLWWD